MAVYDKIRGTIESIFQFGLGGPNLKNNAGVIEARDAADAGFAQLRAAPGSNGNDVATISQVPVNGLAVIAVPFSFADAGGTVTSAAQIPAGAKVMESRVDIETAFDAAATIDVGDGTTASKWQADAELDEATVNTYAKRQQTPNAAATNVVVTVGASTATAGQGTAYIFYATPSN